MPGEWVSVWLVERSDVTRKQIPTILSALLEEELNQNSDKLHFTPLKIDQKLAITGSDLPAAYSQRVISRIAECRGWIAGRALTPVMFRAYLNEQHLPFSLTEVEIAPPEELSTWAGADA